jgi:hypothetical protein
MTGGKCEKFYTSPKAGIGLLRFEGSSKAGIGLSKFGSVRLGAPKFGDASNRPKSTLSNFAERRHQI